jgi:hypothetical protein
MQKCIELIRYKKKQRQHIKYQWLCGIDNQEITAQIKKNFVVSNAFNGG